MKKKIKTALSILFISLMLPVLLYSQDSAGDVWPVLPEGVEPGEEFAFEVHANSGTAFLASYDFNVYYDSRYIGINTSLGSNGVAAGPDGFVAAVSQGVDMFICMGFDPTGTGPGTDLHVITVNCIARESGISLIRLDVDTLTDASTYTIGTPRGRSGSLTIGSNGIAGDVNQSGDLSIVDALLVAQFYTFVTVTVAIDTSVADVNLDTNIDIIDALLIAQNYVGLIGPLPFSGTPPPPGPTPTSEEDPTPTPQVIYFDDEVLEAEIRNILMLPAGEVTYVYEVINLESIYLFNSNITDLTGLEYFSSLTSLRLPNNSVSDITPISNLTQLTLLNLANNNITDISPISG